MVEHPTPNDESPEQLRQQLAKTERALAAAQTKLARQLKLAARVHKSLLPKPVCDQRIHVDVRYVPVEEVGGDYCQVRFSDPETCYVTMCDVTGHGIGPALLATRVSSHVRHGIVHGLEPGYIVRSLNQFICDHFEETYLYLTFVVAQIDLERCRITWSGAGHPSPLLIRAGGQSVQPLVSQNLMIGTLRDCLAREPQHTVDIEPGDRLLFYTDGLTETVNSDGGFLGTAGLGEVAARASSVGLFDLADYVLDWIARYQHGPTTDDKTLIVAEIQ